MLFPSFAKKIKKKGERNSISFIRNNQYIVSRIFVPRTRNLYTQRIHCVNTYCKFCLFRISVSCHCLCRYKAIDKIHHDSFVQWYKISVKQSPRNITNMMFAVVKIFTQHSGVYFTFLTADLIWNYTSETYVRILPEIKWICDTCCCNQFSVCQVNLNGACETVASHRVASRHAWRIVHLFLHVPAVLTGYIFSRKTRTLGERERKGGGEAGREIHCYAAVYRIDHVFFARGPCGSHPTKIQNICIIMQSNVFATMKKGKVSLQVQLQVSIISSNMINIVKSVKNVKRFRLLGIFSTGLKKKILSTSSFIRVTINFDIVGDLYFVQSSCLCACDIKRKRSIDVDVSRFSHYRCCDS